MRDDAKAPARTESLWSRASTTTCFKNCQNKIATCTLHVYRHAKHLVKHFRAAFRFYARALPTAVCFAADAGTKCARFCSIAASRKTSTAFEVRSERSDASAARLKPLLGQPPQNQIEWKGLVAWPVDCGWVKL